jgi:hypothetical protein
VRHAEALRLHRILPKGRSGDQGQGVGEDVQINPPHGPGRADPQPEQDLGGWANYFRYGVSKTTFSAVDHHAWGRLMRWIRAKYKGRTGLSLKNMRRRFCDRGWRFAHNGVMFTGASSVTVTRYRYRGSRSPPRGPRHRQPPPTADHRAETRGEPGTGRPVRRVREGASGK